MRWTPGGESQNVEDRRGSGGFGMGPIGIGGGVVLLILSLIFGRDFVSGSGGSGSNGQRNVGGEVAPVQESPEEAKEVQFVSFVLDTAQATWASILPRQMGTPWHDAKLVLFRNATQTGCGVGQTAMGPFYCPLDQKIYIDLGFYDELRSRFGAPGDFAQAYVLTHELGHHVQHLLGIDDRVRRAQIENPDQANALSVRLELQADCFAGIWAHETQREQMLEPGDVEEALNAASSVGDDRIQRAATGHVNADTFTHGTAVQRAMWFRRGFDSGNPKECNTFASA
ncbi:MAG TPA: neutral zinc metallopeptidase [Gemmatimonadaceae bacterium]|jgi:predicted metalloprotease|nr:neutral zinc metallopeptidase [Gemmatimonadaceae bacterium]